MRVTSIWITWQNSQRSHQMSMDLKLPIFAKEIDKNLFARHFFSCIWTIYVLLKIRPVKIYLQYSFLLLVVLAIYKKIRFNTVKIICDCHTKALRRSVSGFYGKIFWWIKRESFQSVDIAVVSNSEMIPDIKILNSNFVILPDKIPNVVTSRRSNVNEKYCVFVCTYAVDEPLDDVIAAANSLDGTIKIFCTGKIPKKLRYLKDNPYENIVFTDYLRQEDYYHLISSADCILALTSENGCLQCAGYEALSTEVPVVLSNTTALKAYFEDAAIYVNHEVSSIVGGVIKAIDEKLVLIDNMKQLKLLREQEYDIALTALINAT